MASSSSKAHPGTCGKRGMHVAVAVQGLLSADGMLAISCCSWTTSLLKATVRAMRRVCRSRACLAIEQAMPLLLHTSGHAEPRQPSADAPSDCAAADATHVSTL